MSITRHHNDWLSLLEVSGPFLSLPVLLRVFPQGLDALDKAQAAEARLAYEEWLDNQKGSRPEPAIHALWVRYVLECVLGFEKASLLEGPAIPIHIKATVAEHGEILRPDLAIRSPLPPLGEGLGVRAEGATQASSGVRAQGVRVLITVYPSGQKLESPLHERRWKASPATRLMELLRATGVPLGLATNGEQWMLAHAPRGETTSFISWYASLWFEEPVTLRAFTALLGAGRTFGVAEEDTLEAMLRASANQQQEVTDQLGYQVRRAVEVLIRALDKADQDQGRALLQCIGEGELYEAALTVMMRLVFLFSAEERGLLLLDEPIYYQNYAVSTLRAQLREAADQQGEEVLERRFDAWCRLIAAFRAVHGGIQHDRLHLPTYGGSLFDPEKYPFLEGRSSRKDAKAQSRDENSSRQDAKAQREKEIKNLSVSAALRETESGKLSGSAALREISDPLPVNNRTVLHLLESLQILRVKVPGGGPAEARRLSFRALDVEQIGHVYEGLLDHITVRAGETVLGLSGTREKEPEIPLSELLRYQGEEISRKAAKAQRKEENLSDFASLREPESENLSGFASLRETSLCDASLREDELIDFLKEQTGRSASALRKALHAEPDGFALQKLKIACNNDEGVYRQVRPFAGLLREDDFGYPTVFLAGSVYMTAGTTRRATGTHYTPRSLTEPIVQHTLEPLVYLGPAEGLPKEKWALRSPAELLELKVCDPAMGSAGFLVQVVRYLSERLVEAWEKVEENSRLEMSSRQDAKAQSKKDINPLSDFATLREIRITPEGKLSTGAPGETIIPSDDEERLILARRLVADRCIYGVDKNPLAVEIAKLSIWLTTMDKGRPFSFLDHALKCGDSLVGASAEDFLRWARGWRGSEGTLFDSTLQDQIELARQKRRELESFEVLDVRDAERKARLLAEAEAALARVERGCDLLVGSRLLGLSEKETEELQINLLFPYMAGEEEESELAQAPLAAAQKVRAFHWEFEFPEVFEKGGFSAFVGNPPFLGGGRITTILGDNYLKYLRLGFPNSHGQADLCAFFFLRSFVHIKQYGTIGLIATNTIAQGDTRETGLDFLLSHSGRIYLADSSVPWPGFAAVNVSIIHVIKGNYQGSKILDGQEVESITSLLDAESHKKPYPLVINSEKAYRGMDVLGMGFTITYAEAQKMISTNARNSEVLFPYLIGEDINDSPEQEPSRWVINFFDWPLEKAETYRECMKIVREKVYPERINNKDKQRREIWWRFTRPRVELFEILRPLKFCFACSRVSKYLSFAKVQTGIVYSDATVVVASDKYSDYSIVQSSVHEVWARKYSSSLEMRLRYSVTDAFETFPFPLSPLHSPLGRIGESYHEYRRQIMLARQEGLTATYNRFHNPKEKSSDIARLRELHVEMDNAVAAAYGWSDLDLGHGFHETPQGLRYTISEAARREVLGRLLKLNHERYEEEVKAGLHEKKSSSKQKGRAKSQPRKKKGDQMKLL